MKQTEYVYGGVEHNPKPIIAIDNKTLKINVDYELSYTNNRDCGAGTVTITGKENYTGKVEKTFQITPKTPEKDTDYKIALPVDSTYDGKPREASVWTRTSVARSQFGITTAQLCRFVPELTTWRSRLHQVKTFLQLNG